MYIVIIYSSKKNINKRGKKMGSVVNGITNAVGDVIGGFAGGNAASNASQAQINAEQNAMNLSNLRYSQNAPNYQPYLNTGNQANQQLAAGLGPNGALGRQFTQTDFQQSPAYAFNMQQGLQAINNSASVRGGALSGGTMKAMSNYGQQNASNEFQNAYNRFTQNQQQNYAQLSGGAALGLNAATGLGNLGTNQVSQMAQMYGAQGNAQAAGTMGNYNSISGGLSGGLGALTNSGALNGLSGIFGGTAGAGAQLASDAGMMGWGADSGAALASLAML